MHWVIQKGVLRDKNLGMLVEALERANLPYSVVEIPRGGLRLVPEVHPDGLVMVCGAISMSRIARQRRWSPGSFMNDNFDFSVWKRELGDELLNCDAEFTTVEQLSISTDTFVRPVADTKEFNGGVISPADISDWKVDNAAFANTSVLSSPVREIYREYRLFMTDDEVITGSQYMQAGRPHASGTSIQRLSRTRSR